MKKTLLLTFDFLLLTSLAFFWWIMFQIIFPYKSGETDLDFLQSKQHIIHLRHYRWSFYLHIFSSLWVLASGLTQFSDLILARLPNLHRWVGKIYVGIILFVSGPAALVMAFYANGGWVAKTSFVVLSVAWWWTTWQGYRAIRRGELQVHRHWMIRSFALTFSAITLRAMQFGLAMWAEISPEVAYQMVAWPSWLVNLAVAEWLIFYRKNWKAVKRFSRLQ